MTALIDLRQGTPEWHAHRAQYRNASDAPAMMGCSPYETRTQLLHRLYTGVQPKVDAATQRRFDEGHRAEALCRPLAEAILEEDLAPAVVVDGHLSASLDGRTLMGDVDWEHKLLNDELRAVLPEAGVGGPGVGDALPLLYRVQMAHQQYCSDAEKTLFSASKWADDGTLIEARHCVYERDLGLMEAVLAGWVQFERDLTAYVPPPEKDAVVAEAQSHLPAVSVQVSGELSIISNLVPFGVALREFVGKIPRRPSTDQEFADTEAACKRLREVEDKLQAAEDSALASMADVNDLRRVVGELRELARSTRLGSEKLVRARKEQIREEEVARGTRALAEHVEQINARLGGRWMPPQSVGNFAVAIKGLKTIDSLRNAIDTELARAKIAANETADRIRDNIQTINAACMPTLFADSSALVLKDPEAVTAIVAQRVADHRAQEERRMAVERERIRAEEAAKAQAEVASAQKPAALPLVTPPAPPVSQGDSSVMPRISLGMMHERLGFQLSQQFIDTTLGVKPSARIKASVLYRPSEWATICDKLAAHVIKLSGEPWPTE
jgi:predicted phage-related endonuclease